MFSLIEGIKSAFTNTSSSTRGETINAKEYLLQTDILYSIISFLNMKEIITLSKTSQSIYICIDETKIYNCLLKENYYLDELDLEILEKMQIKTSNKDRDEYINKMTLKTQQLLNHIIGFVFVIVASVLVWPVLQIII